MSWNGQERRRYVRVSLPLEIYVSGSKSNLPAKTINVSAGGLRLLLTHKFNLGHILNLDIYGVKKEPLICRGKVLWMVEQKKSPPNDPFRYDTGIEFYKMEKENFQAMEKIVADTLALR